MWSLPLDSKDTSSPRKQEVFDWIISSDLLLLNNPGIPILLYRFCPDILFAPSFLVLSSTWKVVQDLGSDYLPILLTVPLSTLFFLNEQSPSINFQKARRDNYAFYFDYQCPFVKEYS